MPPKAPPVSVRTARLLLEQLESRKKRTPLAYARAWHQPAPQTSQLEALKLAMPGHLMTLVLGGNRTGKSEIMAQWAVAMAAGRDAYVDSPAGRVYWVKRWMEANGLPEEMIPPGPGVVWLGSPSFGASLEQIRPKISALVPQGTTWNQWHQAKEARGYLPLPGGEPGTHQRNGGMFVSKAYKQYDQDNQAWEGANVRAICLDEQPTVYANISAAISRLVDQRGRLFMALTPLRGKDWLYRDLVLAQPPWLRIYTLHGADNPHIPQDMRQMMLAAMPEWQRKSRDIGAFCSPEGAIYSFDRAIHSCRPISIPVEWPRILAVDWGVKSPHALWGAVSPDGTLYVYREVAMRRKSTEPQIPTDAFLQHLKDAENGTPEGLHLALRYGVADSAEPHSITQAAAYGFSLKPTDKAMRGGVSSILKGIELVEARLVTVNPLSLTVQKPRLYVFDCCPMVMDEMEGLKWGKEVVGQEPRPDPACSDHGPDCLRYMVSYADMLGYR